VSAEQPSAVLIVAPVGAYWKRVQNGIRMIISAHCRPRKTDVYLFLVVDSKWAQGDPKYIEECVQPLQKEYGGDPWASEFPKYNCETVYLDPENKDENTLWLLDKLLSFFKKGPNRRAFVDLTSAPREWVYSAFHISNFFSDVDFYFVKSGRKKFPSEYSHEEKTDEGMFPEYVLRGSLTPPLFRWLRPRDEEGKENIQHKLFKLIYQIASEKKAKILDLPELTISIKELAERAKDQISYYKTMPLEDAEKSISRYLTDIDRLDLFKRVSKTTIVANRKVIVIMQALFGR